jgi:uncharacterized protein YbcI
MTPKGQRDIVTDVMRSVITALLLAILTAAASTYMEVKMLRRDVNELRHDLDALYGETNDVAQKIDRR